jgi:hypothetical protein
MIIGVDTGNQGMAASSAYHKVGVGFGVPVLVRVAVDVDVGPAVPVRVAVFVAVGPGVPVRVAVGVGVGVGVTVVSRLSQNLLPVRSLPR